jgi:hypothetical protein
MRDRLAAVSLLFAAICFSSTLVSQTSRHASEIRGKVVSVDRGEPLARVQVAVLNQQGDTLAANIPKTMAASSFPESLPAITRCA